MKRLTLGMLLAIVASAILVAPGGAAKPVNALDCNPTTTTVSFTAGTTSISGTITLAGGGTFLFFNNPAVPLNGPGSLSLDTPGGAARATATITTK